MNLGGEGDGRAGSHPRSRATRPAAGSGPAPGFSPIASSPVGVRSARDAKEAQCRILATSSADSDG